MNKKDETKIINRFIRSYEFPTIEKYISKPYEELIIKLDEEIKEQDKEIERLNNIIDELEEWCLSWKENDKYCYLASNNKDKCRYDIWEEVLDKLKELKEGK